MFGSIIFESVVCVCCASYYSQSFRKLCVDVCLERENFRIEVRYTLPLKDFEFIVSGLTNKEYRHLIPLGANSVPCSSSFKWEVLRAWICISKAEEIYSSCNSYSIQ